MSTTANEADLLRKISGLLAKAEGTDNPHEAEAFFAKANEMMLRHAIDEARVRAAQKGRSSLDDIVLVEYMFASYAHHAKAKEALLQTAAKANSVNCYVYDNRKNSNNHLVEKAGLTGLYESQWARLIGYKADIEATKLLYLSLTIQAQRFASEDWRVRYGKAKHSSWEDGQIGKFQWLSEHMEEFAHSVERRFKEVRDMLYAEIEDSKALISDKDANVMEWMYEHGYARRPSPPSPTTTCWTAEPESNRPTVQSGPRKGLPNTKWRALYCIRSVHSDAPTATGPYREHVDGNPEHTFTYDTGPDRYSYYVSKGTRNSHEARSLGRAAASRADIGLTRVGNDAARLRG